MTDFKFCWFSDYEDSKIARLETTESEVPVNIYAEPDSDFNLQEDDLCSVEILGVGSEIEFYEDEDDFQKANTQLASISMIPMGTFSLHDDDNFQESPHIIFTGKILDVEMNPDADEDEPNCCALVETLEMLVNVYFRAESSITAGGILHGVAWLCGDILRKAE